MTSAAPQKGLSSSCEQPASAAALQARLSRWPGVRVLTHPERGTRFCACQGEFLHFHGDRQMDVRLSLMERDRALSTGAAHFHPRAHDGGWVIVDLESKLSPQNSRPSSSLGVALRLAAAAYRWRLQAIPIPVEPPAAGAGAIPPITLRTDLADIGGSN